MKGRVTKGSIIFDRNHLLQYNFSKIDHCQHTENLKTAITAAGVVPCGGPKKSPRTSSIVQIIFSFWSFVISGGILRNQKIIIGLDSFSNQHLIYIWPHFDLNSLCIDYRAERCEITVFLFGSMLSNL